MIYGRLFVCRPEMKSGGEQNILGKKLRLNEGETNRHVRGQLCRRRISTTLVDDEGGLHSYVAKTQDQEPPSWLVVEFVLCQIFTTIFLLLQSRSVLCTMAPLKFLVVAVVAGVAAAFSPSTSGARLSTKLNENFGLGGASLDIYDAQPDLLKGEGQYKQYVNKINKDNMLNRQVRGKEGWDKVPQRRNNVKFIDVILLPLVFLNYPLPHFSISVILCSTTQSHVSVNLSSFRRLSMPVSFPNWRPKVLTLPLPKSSFPSLRNSAF